MITKVKKEKKTTFPLQNIPEDVKRYILQVQGEIKCKKGISQYSQQLVIFQIIREHKEFSDIKKTNRDE